MDEMLAFDPGRMLLQSQRAELEKCRDIAAGYGLSLTEEDMAEVTESRADAMRSTGQVQFGGGVMEKLTRSFGASPYADPHDFGALLCQMQELFYYFRSDPDCTLSDDELIDCMARVFDGAAQGSADYLAGLSPWELEHGGPADE